LCLQVEKNQGVFKGGNGLFPPLTSTVYTPRDIKRFFKNSRFQTRGVYTART